VFVVDYSCYLLRREDKLRPPQAPATKEQALKIPGIISVPGGMIEASVIGVSQIPVEYGENIAFLDFAKAGNLLTIRRRRRGDRFQPLGMARSKNLADF